MLYDLPECIRCLRSYVDGEGFVREVVGTGVDQVRFELKRPACALPARLAELAVAIALPADGVIWVQDETASGGLRCWTFPFGKSTRTFAEPFTDETMTQAREDTASRTSRA